VGHDPRISFEGRDEAPAKLRLDGAAKAQHRRRQLDAAGDVGRREISEDVQDARPLRTVLFETYGGDDSKRWIQDEPASAHVDDAAALVHRDDAVDARDLQIEVPEVPHVRQRFRGSTFILSAPVDRHPEEGELLVVEELAVRRDQREDRGRVFGFHEEAEENVSTGREIQPEARSGTGCLLEPWRRISNSESTVAPCIRRRRICLVAHSLSPRPLHQLLLADPVSCYRILRSETPSTDENGTAQDHRENRVPRWARCLNFRSPWRRHWPGWRRPLQKLPRSVALGGKPKVESSREVGPLVPRAAAAPSGRAFAPASPAERSPNRRLTVHRQLLVMFGVYLFTVGLFNHVQTSSGVQVQGHPGEQLPWGYCEVTFAHSS